MDRFQAPVQGKQFQSEYDIPSDLIADLIARDVQCVVVQTLNLATAGSFVLTTPGRGFVPYFWATSSSNKQRVLNGLVSVFIGTEAPTGFEDAFPAKHNRGFRGTFSKLYLSWNAQANTSVDFIIHRSKRTPWMTDDSLNDQASGAIDGLTGDVTASGPGIVVATLATVNSSPGLFGDTSHTLIAQVNAKGLITGLASTSIAIAESQVTGLVSDLAAINTAIAGKQASGNYITSLTGDVTASGPGAAAATLAANQPNVNNLSNASGVEAQGVITNSNAPTGYKGESSLVNSPTGGTGTPGATGVFVALASKLLQPGDYDIEASVSFTTGATSVVTAYRAGLSLNPTSFDTTASGGVFIKNTGSNLPVNATQIDPTGKRIFKLGVATTVYLVGRVDYSVLGGASWDAESVIIARRVR